MRATEIIQLTLSMVRLQWIACTVPFNETVEALRTRDTFAKDSRSIARKVREGPGQRRASIDEVRKRRVCSGWA
jgi:hypothetical protein